MLSIVGHKQCMRVETELDDYVPFKLRCENESPRPHLYWRTGDLESTLLEVEISPVDGQVVEASLLLTGEVSNGFPPLSLPVGSLDGVPLVHTREWVGDRSIDEPKPLRVFVEGSSLLILLDDADATTSIEACNLVFGVSADASLVWIIANDLSSERLAALIP